MNDTMSGSTASTDDEIVARLRRALDEVAAGADALDADLDADLVPLRPAQPTRRRWLGVAAATVLLAGGAGWALNTRTGDEPASAPGTTIDPTAPDGPSEWFIVNSPGLVPQAAESQAVLEGPSNPVVTWISTDGIESGLLVLTQYFDGELGVGGPRSNHRELVVNADDGSQWQFWSYGMTPQRRDELAAQVQPAGDGVPYLLDDPSVQLLSIGDLGPALDIRTQTYWLGDDWATIGVGTDRGLGRGLAMSTVNTMVSIAGFAGYRGVGADGVVTFVWSFAPQRWAQLTVSAGIADRADEIAASVTSVGSGRASTPPVATTIQAVGEPTQSVAEHDGPWFALDTAAFEPGEAFHAPAVPVAEQSLFQAWEVRNGDVLGLLTVEIVTDGEAPFPGADDPTAEEIAPLPDGRGWLSRQPGGTSDADLGLQFVWQRSDGSIWWFQSAGLSRDLVVKAVTGAVPGSGVPIVIPDPTMTVLAVGPLSGESVTQYAGAADDGVDDVAVVLTVAPDSSPLRELMGAANVVETTVAGSPGYAALMDGGGVEVAWDAGGGWWGGLSISAAQARGADGIIAAVIPATL